MAEPLDTKLYEKVKKMADKRFESKTGVYKSSWIVKEYKRLGGKYKDSKPSDKTGLKRWYKEKWVDINRPIKKNGKIIGYQECGRKSILKKPGVKYPVCRPTKRVTFMTPKTLSEISKKSLEKAKKEKQKVKSKGNIKFGGKVKKENLDKKNDMEGGKSQYYGKRSEIMIPVPENVKKVALYSFKLKEYGFGGGIETGWKRAKQLSTKDYIPIEDLRYMRNWFARHIYASYPSYKEWIKAGRPKDSKWHKKHGIISWLIWGGDPAFKWINSKKNVDLLNKHYNKNYKQIVLK